LPRPKKRSETAKKSDGGKPRIGDDWNAMRINALSQRNPSEVIAELAEDSTDAEARTMKKSARTT
jgi:hypothetical protein